MILSSQKKFVSGTFKWYKFRKAFITSQEGRKYVKKINE